MKQLEQSGKPMSEVLPKKARWIKDRANKFYPEENRIVTASGEEIKYEYLVVAMGLQLDYDKAWRQILNAKNFVLITRDCILTDQRLTRSFWHTRSLFELFEIIRRENVRMSKKFQGRQCHIYTSKHSN